MVVGTAVGGTMVIGGAIPIGEAVAIGKAVSFAEPVLVSIVAQASQSSISWQTIQTVATVAGPIIGLLISFLLWIHKRIESLEDKSVTTRSALFGNEENELQEGISAEISTLKAEIQELDRRISKIEKNLLDKKRRREIRQEQED